MKKLRYQVVFGMLLVVGSLSCFASDVAVFQGKITVQDGSPVKGAVLKVIHETLGEKTIKLQEDGSFKSRLFELGKYSVTLDAPGYIIYSIKTSTQNAMKMIEQAEQTILDETQKIPPMTAMPEKTIVYEFVLAPGDFFDKKSQQEQLGQVEKYIVQAEEKIKLKQPMEAIPLLDKAIGIKPDVGYSYYLMGVAFYDNHDEATARKHFEKSIDVKPDIEGAHFYLGKMAYEAKDIDSAIRHFEAELTVAPNQTSALESLGIIYRDKGEKGKAAENFEKLRKIKPVDEKVLAELLALYTALGDEPKVKEIAAAQESLGQQDAATYYNLGSTYWKEKNYSAAADAFQKSIDKDPSLPQAHKGIGYCLIQLKNNTQAKVHLKKYLELLPEAEDKTKIEEILKQIEVQ